MMDAIFIEAVIQTAANYPSDVDEIKEVGLTAVVADAVSSPRVAEARVSLGCRLIQQLEFGTGENHRAVFFGEVLLFHINNTLLKEDSVDSTRMNFVGRLGAGAYCRTTDIIKLKK
jgi:flavin reductase (DIM6/NTAB) family NADH-FMN oxidoreductase RutF